MTSIKRVLVCVVVLFCMAAAAKADTVSVNLDVEGPSSTIYNQTVSVPPCDIPTASSTLSGFCAFGAAGLPVDATWSQNGALVNSIGGVAGDSNNYWLWFLNGDPAQQGIDKYILKNGDNILWALGREPLKVSLSKISPKVNATSTVTVLGFNPINFDFEPLAGASLNGLATTTNASGKVDILATSSAPITFSVSATGFLPSQQFTITPRPDQITLTIRDGSNTTFSGPVNLPASTTPDLMIEPTNSTSTIAVPAHSLLGVLENLETSNNSFNITNLAYYPSFNSFIINCIAVPASNPSPDCSSWTDAINGSYPQIGMDHQLLHDGDVVYLYFGSSHKTVLSASTVTAGQSVTATAQQYDLPTGSYKPLTGVTLGVGTENSNFTFTETATSTVDASGNASFTINTPGSYSVGIKEDFYYPLTSLTVTSATSTGSGGGGSPAHGTFNLPTALAFLAQNQNSDGSFGSSLVTDWSAVALGSQGSSDSKTKLLNFLQAQTPAMSAVTDYERHAMALEALGINPYNGTAVNYITPIVNTFDGTQIGTSNDNDDIFALIVLEHAGYSSADSLMKKEATYVLSTQQQNGSWDNNPDMTAAAIQALGPLFNLPGVNQALGPAAGYLLSAQQANGGWGSIDSTSWVQSAINGIIENHTPGLETESFWTAQSGQLPTDALAAAQLPDGGVQSSNRVWSTAYVIAAASGKSWYSTLKNFAKVVSAGSLGGGSPIISPTTTTSTLLSLTNLNASSTPATGTNPSLLTQSSSSTPPALPSITPTPTSTPTFVQIKHNPNSFHKLVKPQPQILGESTQEPRQAVEPTPLPTPTVTETNSDSSPGFWGKLWGGVKNIFGYLF